MRLGFECKRLLMGEGKPSGYRPFLVVDFDRFYLIQLFHELFEFFVLRRRDQYRIRVPAPDGFWVR